MPSLLARFRVADYPSWKPVFDAQGDTRRANGSGGGRLFRNATDPNEILTLLEWDDLDRARLFVQSDDIHDAMGWTAALDRPDVWILEEAD